jgi:hypothetical protein
VEETGYEHLDDATKLLDSSLAMRLQAIEHYVSDFEQLYKLTKMNEMYTTIIDEIKKVDPDLQKQIIERLCQLSLTKGLVNTRRTGFFQRVKDRVASFFHR